VAAVGDGVQLEEPRSGDRVIGSGADRDRGAQDVAGPGAGQPGGRGGGEVTEATTKGPKSSLQDAVRLSKTIGGTVNKGDVILRVRDLGVNFWVNGSWFTAAKGLTYDLKAGEVLAIVGESGSGKTQSAMSLIGLVPKNGRATGSAKLKDVELVGMSMSRLQQVRGNEISVIFQEPMTALNPVYTVGFQIVETLRTHFVMAPAQAKARALELMRLVK